MNMDTKDPIVFLSAKRTPFATYGGALKNISATDLGVVAAKAAIADAKINPQLIDHVVFGNVLQSSSDAIYCARHIGLKCEIPFSTPALTLNRLCGSGFEAIVNGARLLACDEAQAVLVGGTENLSQAPHVVRGARWGLALGQSQLEDSLWTCLNDTYVNLPMAITAENLAEQYEISQDEVDHFSCESQKKYFEAHEKNIFQSQLTQVQCGTKKKPFTFEKDEHPRPQTTIDGLKKLPKVFKKDGVIHAGAASGICDGAAALVMARESFAKKHSLPILGKLLAHGVSGCDPKIMGIGPVPAIKNCLKNTKYTLNDLNMIEVNEAFAPQVLAVKKELNICDEKLNMHGGAIAIGHPLAASGARICAHLVHALKNSGGGLGLGSACIGGGQGIALLVESL